jgi:hypothetical protein
MLQTDCRWEFFFEVKDTGLGDRFGIGWGDRKIHRLFREGFFDGVMGGKVGAAWPKQCVLPFRICVVLYSPRLYFWSLSSPPKPALGTKKINCK